MARSSSLRFTPSRPDSFSLNIRLQPADRKAVISAGFTGISLGATPTAIANMTAVTKLHGACARAFIILPLASAFFIDIANAVAIGVIVR